ncbi:MAG: GatB/YqeY domain-containing protein [Clostridia bacterium]|nr:GatB/YqeY domain-containing protein [Clostridia bacterium]
MLIDEIKQRNVQAIKEKDANARAILGIVMNKYLLGSVEKRSKQEEMTDIDMVAILQKTIKELNDEMETYEKAGRQEQANEIKYQKALLEGYLPQMMSEEEILEVINGLDDKSIGNVMKHFKANYAGKCDMGTVQKVLKSI